MKSLIVALAMVSASCRVTGSVGRIVFEASTDITADPSAIDVTNEPANDAMDADLIDVITAEDVALDAAMDATADIESAMDASIDAPADAGDLLEGERSGLGSRGIAAASDRTAFSSAFRLYFVGDDGRLHAEMRTAWDPTLTVFARPTIRRVGSNTARVIVQTRERPGELWLRNRDYRTDLSTLSPSDRWMTSQPPATSLLERSWSVTRDGGVAWNGWTFGADERGNLVGRGEIVPQFDEWEGSMLLMVVPARGRRTILYSRSRDVEWRTHPIAWTASLTPLD